MLLGTMRRRGGRAALWLAVGLLIGGTIGAAATYLIKRGKAGIPGGPRLGEAKELDLVPADAAGFVHVRVRDLWHTEGFAEVRTLIEKAGPQARAALDEGFVPAPSTLDRATLVFLKAPGVQAPVPALPLPPPKGKAAPPAFVPPALPPEERGPIGLATPAGEMKVVAVLAFSAPFDDAKVRETYLKDSARKKVADREYWDDPVSSFAAYFHSPTEMVLGDGEGMRLYLTKLAAAGTGPLTSAIEHARSGGRHVVAALNVAQLGLSAKLFDGVPGEFGDLAKHGAAVIKAESLMVGLALGEETRIDVRAKYKDGAAAAESEAALRALAKAGREKLGDPKKQAEAALNGPAGAPKPRPITDLPGAVTGLLGLGSLNSLDEWLADPPLAVKDTEVVLTPKVPSLTSAYASMAAASIGFLLPAVDKVHVSAGRMKDANNLTQIGLAMHGYHDATGGLPAQDGRGFVAVPPKGDGLSWRVHMLPYIEQQNLYQKFNLNEPWDGPTNKPLIDQMPAVYRSPLAPTDPPGQTRYKVFSGKDAVVYPGSKTRLTAITDGTSNTILVVGGGAPVVWTKPDDIPFPGGDVPPAVLALPGQTGCNVLWCDGSVRWVEQARWTPEKLKYAITRAGGEVLNLDGDEGRRPPFFK